MIGLSIHTLFEESRRQEHTPPAPPFATLSSIQAGNVQSHFSLDLLRAMRMHRGLMIVFALAGLLVGIAYFLTIWPEYQAQSVIYVQPLQPSVLDRGASPHWPFDSSSYELYIRQQMLDVTRTDVLTGALDKLDRQDKLGLERWWQRGENQHDYVERLRQAMDVTREGNGYQFSIGVRASNAAAAADLANAVAASYIASVATEQRSADMQRLTELGEERDRVQKEIASDRAEQQALQQQFEKMNPAASSVQSEMQQSADLDADLARLQSRFSTVDEQWHDQMLEENAPGAVSLANLAVAPLHAAKSNVLRNAIFIFLSGIVLGSLVTVIRHKLDPTVYIAHDAERLLGLPLMAQLPDFYEISDGVAEEFILRLAGTIEAACEKSNLRTCIFTGTGPGTGVTVLAARVREMLQSMGRATVLPDASGIPVQDSDANAVSKGESCAQRIATADRGSRSKALLGEMRAEREKREDSLVLIDTAPLTLSADTEYLARFADCTIVVIESGVTTRAQLRAVGSTLQRLNVPAGFVLNRVRLEKADPAFKRSVRAIDDYLHASTRPSARQTVRSHAAKAEDSPVAGQFADRSGDLSAFFVGPAKSAAEPPTPPIRQSPVVPPQLLVPTELSAVPPRAPKTPAPPEFIRPGAESGAKWSAEPVQEDPWWLADLFPHAQSQPPQTPPGPAKTPEPEPIEAKVFEIFAAEPGPEAAQDQIWEIPAQSWESMTDIHYDFAPDDFEPWEPFILNESNSSGEPDAHPEGIAVEAPITIEMPVTTEMPIVGNIKEEEAKEVKAKQRAREEAAPQPVSRFSALKNLVAMPELKKMSTNLGTTPLRSDPRKPINHAMDASGSEDESSSSRRTPRIEQHEPVVLRSKRGQY
jgi:capsular polysaccharide biosynthesis protein/Mrp family chromosome partitioning ATPase